MAPQSTASAGRTPTASSPLLTTISPTAEAPSSSASSYASSISSQTHSPRRVASAAMSRKISFLCAILTASCAGSVTVFSLYGHIFQERLHYSQFQVNGLAISLGVTLYLPVPVLGYMCDRVGPAPLSFMAAVLFGAGYGLAAGLYRKGLSGWCAWEYYAMIAAFATIGVATCAMYLASVATCAKNFGKGKHRGLAIAVPTAAFGLSGMWESQVGSRLFYEKLPDGSKGDVDVFRFFLFLAILLTVVGLIGTAALRIVDEKDLIDDAVEELERSGIMDGSALFSPGRALHRGYGAIERADPFDEDDAGILDPSKDTEVEAARLKKEWVLNAETRRFLSDHTMWCFALGFFFMIGPGEAFLNNLGTIIGTLYPPTLNYVGSPTSAATHVSILGITSTAARLLTGSLTDILAPSPHTQHMQMISSQELPQELPQKRFSISRISFLIFFALAMSLGLVALASGLIQDHGDRFWIVTSLVGAGYGAVFSLTPIIITIIWGVESFSFNWGFVAMFPALGSTMWGLIYSAVYQAGARKPVEDLAGGVPSEPDGIFCYGTQCYAPTFWAMAVSVWIACLMVLWAWKGMGGWSQRGIVI